MVKKVKVRLKDVADEMEMISADAYNFLNLETGEFIYYHEDFSDDDMDLEDFEAEMYVSLPSQFDIHEYEIMEAFVEKLENIQKQNALYQALSERGAFRRFKDMLYETGLEEKWYKYKRQVFLEIARKWCVDNEIPYE
jgi:hypothetical protein